MILYKQTPSQTVGPYFAYGLTPEQYRYEFSSIADENLLGDDTPNQPIRIVGQVIDGAGVPIPDAMIELWQPDASGAFASVYQKGQFKGFGRVGTGTDAQHRFIFETIKPGSVEGQAPHINVIVLMRGLLTHAYTRLYFSDEVEANAQDAVLNSVPADRQNTLIAQRTEEFGKVVYRFDIHMQGDNETVFFDV
ncbi:MAG: protocatechuate 3,4-dioxygenase subunit alpha [Spirosomataceae bacterium]